MTMQPDCDNLDAYLTGELPADVATQFATHLKNCAECRAQVDEQQWIDNLLRSPIAATLESPPAQFADSINFVHIKHRRRVGLIAVTFAAAASLALATGWTVWWINRDSGLTGEKNSQLRQLVRNPVDSSMQPGTIAEQHQPSPRATVVGDANTIVLPVASPYPDVTIVRVYPVYQPQFANSQNGTPPAAGGQFSWRDDFNGGSP